MEGLLVRPERPEDLARIRYVNEQAFGRPAEARLVEALRSGGKVLISLVAEAERDGQIAGHILFSPVHIVGEKQSFAAAGLGPLAVLPALQRRGIGSLLVKCGLEHLRKAGSDRIAGSVVVLGHPGYYPRFGFVPASRFGIRSEFDVPDEVFMALELQPRS